MKKFDLLFRGVEILMAFFLAVMIFLVFANVVLRYLFSTGFAWSEEVARLCFIYLVYLGSIGAMRDNEHLLIDSVLTRIPALYQKIVYFLVQASIIWVMVILTRGSWQLVLQNYHDRWVATQFPVFLVYGIGVVTGVSIIIIALANMYRLIVAKMSVRLAAKPGENLTAAIVSWRYANCWPWSVPTNGAKPACRWPLCRAAFIRTTAFFRQCVANIWT